MNNCWASRLKECCAHAVSNLEIEHVFRIVTVFLWKYKTTWRSTDFVKPVVLLVERIRC